MRASLENSPGLVYFGVHAISIFLDSKNSQKMRLILVTSRSSVYPAPPVVFAFNLQEIVTT